MKQGIIAILLSVFAVPAMAVLTLPIAEDAVSQAGEMRVSGGLVLESDLSMYGGRFTYGMTQELSVFAGLGLADLDGFDSEPYLQFGGKYTLPVDLGIDLALRGGFGVVSFSEGQVDVDILNVNGGVLASKALDQSLTVYGFGGLSYVKSEFKGTLFGQKVSDSETETELALAGGVLYAIDQSISFYGELAHIDELFISGGVRFNF